MNCRMPAPRTTGVLLGVTLALAAGFCVSAVPFAAARAESIVVHDARGRDVAIGNRSRIVSIGGAITEILYALGLEDRIVGVDTTSLYPPKALGEKPNVGYMRQLSAEGVLGLNPSLVLAAQGSGPKETMDVLEAAKVPLVLVPETFSEAGLIDKIKLVGHAMDADKRAECLTEIVSGDLAQLRELRSKVTKPVRVMFVMSLLNGRAMAAGQNTAANEIIAMAGAVNAIVGYDGYKIINDEAIVAAKPDVVLSIQRGKDSVDAEAVYVHPAFALTPVAANKTFISMEGLYLLGFGGTVMGSIAAKIGYRTTILGIINLLGFGPRTAAAARDLSIKLYPALAPQAEKFKPAALSANCRL